MKPTPTDNETYSSQVINGTYFPHIDGIRALAVLPVLLYHLSAAWCPGGFSGVDVFFVISGYLIGGGILRDLRHGTFSFASFYTRRIRRIMPAYFAMILGALAAGLLLYHYEPLESLGNAATRSSYFFANFFCYKFLGNYFAGDAALHPLINLWSLSVEEQFYIIIPLLMWLLYRLRRPWLTLSLALLALASFLHAEQLLTDHSARHTIKAFYMLAPRAWELLAGVLLAQAAQRSHAPSAHTQARAALAWVGLLLILAAYAFPLPHFPGAGALPAVAGALLLIPTGHSGSIARFLTHPLAVGIGRISYSLYLWHWPVIAFMHYIYGKNLTAAQATAAAALSFALAWASWRWVEMPIRRMKELRFRQAIIGLLVICLFTGGLGLLLYQSHGLVHYLHPAANRYASLEYPPTLATHPEGAWGIPQLNHLRDEKGKEINHVLSILGDPHTAPDFVLIGDSHAEALQIGLDDTCARHGRAGLAVGLKTCPLSGIALTNTFSNITAPFLDWLRQAPGIRTVIIMGYWQSRMPQSGSGQILYRPGSPIPADDSGNAALLEEGLAATCRHIREMGKEVILIGPVPVLRFSPGSEIRRRTMLGQSTRQLGESISRQEFDASTRPVRALLQRLEAQGLARVVPLAPVLEQNGHFYGLHSGQLFYHDNSHLSGDGSRYVIQRLYPQIFPPNGTQPSEP